PMAVVKDQPVEHRVDDIAHGPGQDQGNRQDQGPRGLLADDVHQPVANAEHGKNPKNGQHQFSGGFRDGQEIAQFGAPGRPFVLDKVNLEPTEHIQGFSQDKMGLYVDFAQLVHQKDQGNDQ